MERWIDQLLITDWPGEVPDFGGRTHKSTSLLAPVGEIERRHLMLRRRGEERTELMIRGRRWEGLIRLDRGNRGILKLDIFTQLGRLATKGVEQILCHYFSGTANEEI